MSPESAPRKARRFPYIKISLVFIMLAIYFTIAIQGRNREFNVIQSTYQEFLALQQEGASASEWDHFKINTHNKIDPIVKSLDATATSKFPHKQHLLWASRDYLYPMLDNAQTERSPDQDKFEKHLKAAKQILNQNWIVKLLSG